MGKPVSKDLASRLERVWEKLDDEHLDAFLVTHVPNVRYLTNFEGTSAALLISRNGCNLVTDGR